VTVEADIRAAIVTVTPRVFPDFAPHGTTRPFVTYQQIGGDALNYWEQAMPDKKNGLIQINVWSDTRAEAASLILAIEGAMRTASAFNAKATSSHVADFDAEVPIYGARQDFTVWSTR